MLGISLKPGEFVLIGDVIVRLTQIKPGSIAQLAIVADLGQRVTRLDAWGDPVNCNRRIMAHRNHLDDPAVAQGHALLVLSCGHESIIPFCDAVEMQQSHVTKYDCPLCRADARALKERIAATFNHLGPGGRHTNSALSNCAPHSVLSLREAQSSALS